GGAIQRDGRGIHAHHVQRWKQFPLLRYVVSNGRTLCGVCHKILEPWVRKPKVRRKGRKDSAIPCEPGAQPYGDELQEYRHKRTSVTLLNYHFVWIPARRRKVLMGPVAPRLEVLLREAAERIECEIL